MSIENPRITVVGKGDVFSWSDLDSMKSVEQMHYELEQEKAEIMGILRQREIERLGKKRIEEEKRREFIVSSDTISTGHKNKLDLMFRTSTKSGLENPSFRNAIFSAEGNHANRKKGTWGRDRKQMAENIKTMKEQQWTQEDVINLAFSDAEETDRRNWRRRK